MKDVKTMICPSQQGHVAILAGNSRVAMDTRGKITVEPQLQAFRAALSMARQFNDASVPHRVSLALDHKGIFRKQFLKDGLSNSAKRNPRLSQLKDEVVEVFAPITKEIDIPLESVFIIHEDSARTHASHLVQSGQCPGHLIRWMTVKPQDEDEDEDAGTGSCGLGTGNCSYGTRDVDRVTCAAVTAEYYAKAMIADHEVQGLEVFIEDDPWSSVGVFVRGAALLSALGSPVPLHLNLVQKDGRVISPGRNGSVTLQRDSDVPQTPLLAERS